MIDKSYRKQKYLKKELERLSVESSWHISSMRSIVAATAGLLMVVSIGPYFPPRSGGNSWRPPDTMTQYLTRVKELMALILLFVLVFVLWILSDKLRRKIDVGLGFKRTANFEIIRVIPFLSIKVLILKNRSLFFLRSKHLHFTTVRSRQIITLHRIGTFRLLDYHIHSGISSPP